MGSHQARHAATRVDPASAAPSQAPSGASSRGKRRAATPRRRSVVLPLLGTAALVVAGIGAATVGAGATSDHAATGAASESRYGTDAIGFSGSRERAISRDSERQALRDVADQRLEAEAESQAAERNAQLKALGRAAEQRAGQIAKNQWHLPTQGYHLTARFGQAGGLWSSDHTGLDFAAPSGTPIFAVATGVITEAGSAGAYGNRTVETLPDGTELWYAHQSAIGVKVGQQVIAGQTIGAVGSTGNVTGPHVHLEVRPGGGDPVDPYQALIYHGVKP